jgi:uncharacterized protein (TIGR02996 family)
MTETERSLLDAVLENPDDDLPRLVYADYLDENGDPKRAEFIRAQIVISQAVQRNDYDSDEFAEATKRTIKAGIATMRKWLAVTGLQLKPGSINSIDTFKDGINIHNKEARIVFTLRRGFLEQIQSEEMDWILENWQTIFYHPINHITVGRKIGGRKNAKPFCEMTFKVLPNHIFETHYHVFNIGTRVFEPSKHIVQWVGRVDGLIGFLPWIKDIHEQRGDFD